MHSWEIGHTRYELLAVAAHVHVAVTTWFGFERDFEQTFFFKAQIYGMQSLKASDQKARAQEENQRQSNLRHDERLAQSAQGAGYVASILLQCRGRIFAGRAPAGRETQKNAGENGDRNGKSEDAQIGSQI